MRTHGFVDEHVTRLFRREVQALALLNHPAIAALYQAGHTEDGQHYFAMEKVDGLPLDEYVRRQNLGPRQRLELFLRVCAGIAYAHQRGVIHRDLKPSNILVDADGRPKILDFGLARITDSDITLTTLTGELGRVQGTPAYMSPEQARGQSDAIDLRSDVYSLGVVLYELLCGQLPYEIRNTPLPHALRRICDEPPRRPSIVSRALRGDLETILLKALEKEPGQRYASVSAFTDDVARYLAGQPILARPHSALYQLRKLVSRHKVGAAVVAGALVLLLGFAVTVATLYGQSTDHLRRARLAERNAADEAEAFREVSEYLLGLLEHTSPRSGDDIGSETWAYVLLGKPLPPALRDLVARRGQALLAASQSPGKHLDLAVPLTNIGNLMRGGGELEVGARMLHQALGIMQQAPERFGYQLSYPLSGLQTIAGWRGEYEKAAELGRRAYAVRLKRLGPDDFETSRAAHDLAATLDLLGRSAEAEELVRRRIDAQISAIGSENEFTAYPSEVAAVALYLQARFTEAEPFFRHALAVRAASFPADHPLVDRSRVWLACCLLHMNQREEAERLLREVSSDSPLIRRVPFVQLAFKEVARFYVGVGEQQRISALLGHYADIAFEEADSNQLETPPPGTAATSGEP